MDGCTGCNDPMSGNPSSHLSNHPDVLRVCSVAFIVFNLSRYFLPRILKIFHLHYNESHGKPGCIFPCEDWDLKTPGWASNLQTGCPIVSTVWSSLHGLGLQLYDLYHWSLKHLLLTGEMDMRTKFLTKRPFAMKSGICSNNQYLSSMSHRSLSFSHPKYEQCVLNEDVLLMISVCIYLLATRFLFSDKCNTGKTRKVLWSSHFDVRWLGNLPEVEQIFICSLWWDYWSCFITDARQHYWW